MSRPGAARAVVNEFPWSDVYAASPQTRLPNPWGLPLVAGSFLAPFDESRQALVLVIPVAAEAAEVLQGMLLSTLKTAQGLARITAWLGGSG